MLRDAIAIMQLLYEMKEMGFPIHKYRPRTKHLNVRLHHFRDFVERKEITIHAINSTKDQPADFLTKALNVEAALFFLDVTSLTPSGARGSVT